MNVSSSASWSVWICFVSAVFAGTQPAHCQDAPGHAQLFGSGPARGISAYQTQTLAPVAGAYPPAPFGFAPVSPTGHYVENPLQRNGEWLQRFDPFSNAGSGGSNNCNPKWYMSGMLGMSTWDDERSESINADIFTGIDIDFKDSFAYGMAFGRVVELSSRLPMRIELELLNRKAKVDSVLLNGLQNRDIDGDSRLFSGVVNFLFDLKFMSDRIYPYLGGGVGFAHVNRDIRIGNLLLDDSDIAFAGQTVLGVTVKIKKDFDFYVDWRHTWTGDTNFKSKTTNFPIVRTKFESEHKNSTVMFGVRMYLDNLPFFGKPWCCPNNPYDSDSIRPSIIRYGGSR